jgi:phosphatidate cytidylyltransferase
MNDQDRPDDELEDHGSSDGPRTEGVRIIGAQEAADAAERPDVVRRRRRGQKRFGDRPDDPEDVGDLPKIRISTSDVDPGSPDRFGAVPVIRPDDASGLVHPDPGGPQGGDQGFAAVPDEDAARSYGHARLIDERPVTGADEGVEVIEADIVEDESAEPGDLGDDVTFAADPTFAEMWAEGDDEEDFDDGFGPAGDRDDAGSGTGDGESVRPNWLEPDDDGPAPDAGGLTYRPSWLDEPDPGGLDRVDDDVSPEAGNQDALQQDAGQHDGREQDEMDRGAAGQELAGWQQEGDPGRQPFNEEARAVDERPERDEDDPGVGGTGGGFEDFDDEDSFVLPHWTEPPTGQVPKVVVGEEFEEEPLASYGSQPRWRDEGDRTVETDFDDLVDDAPRLGALGAYEGPGAHEDEVDFFDAEADRDPLEAFAPEEEPVVAAPRRRPGPGRGRGGERPAPSGPQGTGAGGGDRNLVVAVLVGVVLVAVGLLAFSLGGLATTILACVVVGAASFEYFTAVQQRGYQPATLLALVAIVGLLFATYFSGLGAYPVVLTLTVVLGLLWYLWVAPTEHSVRNLGITLLGIMWIGFLGSFATLFLGLGRIIQDRDDAITSNPGIGVLIDAVVASVSHDVGAYFVGRYMGRTPLSTASPNKTQEGLIGGVLTSLVVTMIVVGFIGIAPIGPDKAQTFVFALLCALVAPLGDLCESFVKRDLGLKDFGSVLPGHGGVMDRFDALLFVLPTAYFVTILFDVWGGIVA